MAIWSRSFEVIQNEDTPFILGFASADPSGQLSLATPYSFTGTTVEFTAAYDSNPSSIQLIQLTSTSGAITFGTAVVNGINVGTINFTIPHATSVNFPVGTFYCDLLWKNGGTNIYLAAGPFCVAASLSR